MNRTSGTSDYRGPSTQLDPSRATEGMMGQVSGAAHEIGSFASDVAGAIKERPYTTMAIAGGLAFAIGALWMVRRQQPQSNYEALLSRLPALPDRQSLWPSRLR